MYTFSKLIKKIRGEANLTQSEFARAVGVSTVLITMVETEQKNVSKKLIIKIANKLKVHPFSITPFLFIDKNGLNKNLSTIERKFIKWGEKMQDHLIKDRSRLLRKYGK